MGTEKRIELIRLLAAELLDSLTRYNVIRETHGGGYGCYMGTGGLERNDTVTANKKKIQYLREQLRLLSKQLE